MKIYKFGGASVKNARAVKNVLAVLQKDPYNELLIVVSAMGKTTNALEKVLQDYLSNSPTLKDSLYQVQAYHQTIITELFPPKHAIFKKLASYFNQLDAFLKTNKSSNKEFVYDQIVPYGELLSSTIIYYFLNENNFPVQFLDARECLVTNTRYREAEINWEQTCQAIKTKNLKHTITITQGFIAAEPEHHFITTLGREGSDYSAAIFAYCLNAESVTIWKDVPGVLNADPRYFSNPQLLQHISYKEAIELAFYGASVIHPKTLQPLQRKEIPLYVKSFKNPLEKGTCVGKGITLQPAVSCFILKKNQVLISVSSLDFSFITEHHISYIFDLLHRYKMKVNLIQNSAISFSVCIDNKFDHLPHLLQKLNEQFKVRWNEDVTLYTIRHSTPLEIKTLLKNKRMLLKQESRETVQVIVKEE